MSTDTPAAPTGRSLQIRRIVVNLGGVVGINALALITGPILARALGPSSRGVLAAALLWPTLISTLLTLGIQDAVTYYTSRGHAARTVIATSQRLTSALGLATWILGAPVVFLVMRHFGGPAVISSLIYLAVMPAQMLTRNLAGTLNGLHRYGRFNAIQLEVFAINAFGLVGLWALGELTVRTAAITAAASVAITFATGAITVRRLVRTMPSRSIAHLRRKLLGFGVRSHLSLAPHLLNDRVDQLVISVALPPRQLGLYAVAATIATVPAFVGSAVAVSVLPTLASLHTPTEQLDTARRSILLTAALTCVASAILAVIMQPLIVALFGDRFAAAVPAARVLAGAAIMISLVRVFHSVLKGIGRPLDAAISEGGALLTTGVGLAILLPSLGILGAALTSLIAYTTSVVIGAKLAATALGASPLEFIWRRRR